jgi:AsmA protein
VRLDHVRIEGGTFRFTDERIGKVEQIGNVNANVGLPALGEPLVARGPSSKRGWRFPNSISTNI